MCAHWQKLQLGVQHIAAHVVDGPPNWNRCPALELGRDVVACTGSYILSCCPHICTVLLEGHVRPT